MDGLIIKKEWLDFILDGGKTWEMRSRPTKKRGDILLIQSGSGLVVGRACLDCSGIRELSDDAMHRYYEAHRVPESNPYWMTHRSHGCYRAYLGTQHQRPTGIQKALLYGLRIH
jgi:hypothetical protein